MLDRLARGPATVTTLMEPFSLTQQAISKHVAYLERAMLVRKLRRGRESICELRPETIRAVAQWAANFHELWEERFDNLEEVLEDLKNKEESNE